MHKILFYNKFSICLCMFRALCAHHQEVKIVLFSIWYPHTETSEWSKITKIQFFKYKHIVVKFMCEFFGCDYCILLTINLVCHVEVTFIQLLDLWKRYYVYLHLCLLSQWRATFGRTPLDKWSARRRDHYLTTHNTHKRKTTLPPAGFEPAIPASERPQTHALV